MTVLLFLLSRVSTTFNFVSNQYLNVSWVIGTNSIAKLLEFVSSWRNNWMFRSVSTLEGHGLKCCKRPEWWAEVSSLHSWWRCLEWIRSLVRGGGLRVLQMDLSPPSLDLWTARFHLIITGIILKSSHHHPFGLSWILILSVWKYACTVSFVLTRTLFL